MDESEKVNERYDKHSIITLEQTVIQIKVDENFKLMCNIFSQAMKVDERQMLEFSVELMDKSIDGFHLALVMKMCFLSCEPKFKRFSLK